MALVWQQDRYLSEFSTFGIGGKIRYFTEIRSLVDLQEAFSFIQSENIPFFLLGKGSNCLFNDQGFTGAVLLNRMDWCEWNERNVRVGSGFSLPLLGIQAAKRGLKGLEFAAGIPASVGGAIFMNAGANQQATSDCLVSVQYYDRFMGLRTFTKEEIEFRYRFSSFQEMEGVIVEATFALQEDSDARQRQLNIIRRRMESQPLQEKSAGCIFRNPSMQLSAGEIIDRCGLKGLSVGGASISDVHANFIINQNKASASDVLELIEKIQKIVFEKMQIHLELEVWVIKSNGISR